MSSDGGSSDAGEGVNLIDAGDIPRIKPKEIIPVNNIDGLLGKLDDIKLKLDWIETLDIVTALPDFSIGHAEGDQKALPQDKAEHDFKRETAFYNQAKAAAEEAIARLSKMNIPTRRPPDYFAEMAKSDAHMTKVREKLMSKRTMLERSEKARELREQKKHGKKIQQEVLQQKKSEKKQLMEALKKSKKGKIDVKALIENKREQQRNNNNSNQGKKNKKPREPSFKDGKYGYGGRKKRSKYNTADSSAFLPGMSKKGGFSQGKKHGGKGNQRTKGTRRRR